MSKVVDPNNFFWTDYVQATERIQASVILYDDIPVYVHLIEPHDDGIPRATISNCGEEKPTQVRKQLNSPKFKRFRELPKLGWMNLENRKNTGAVYVQRLNTNTRSHGLSNANTSVSVFNFGKAKDDIGLKFGILNFNHVTPDRGFVNCHKNEYPSLESILKNIRDGSSIAYSRDFAIMRDHNGIKWLYRRCDRVGIFTSDDTLCLFNKTSYLREEIMEDKAFTLRYIREF